ncbi:unnamed protein product, partial [Closterium sp. Naga37s-1]
VADTQAKTVTVGRGWFSPWSYGVESWKPPRVKPGDVLVFRWRMARHDVWQLRDLAAYTNCTFATGKRLKHVHISERYKYKVPRTAAGTTLFFACSVDAHCSAYHMKTQIPVSP